jgi:Tfp pilus assembly protein PilF
MCILSLTLFSYLALAYARIPEVIMEQKQAVVTIYIYEGDKQVASGSGCIIDANGIVVTNYHVLSAAAKFSNATYIVKLANGNFVKPEKLIAVNQDYDLALIQLKGKQFPFTKLAKGYKPSQGEDVIVIGSPMGLETTVSNGIISSIRGEDEFLQITAPISPGSSGSPVFNSNGDVIGIATLLIEGGQNLNFAIPVKYVSNLLDNKNQKEWVDVAPAPAPELAPAPAPAPTPAQETTPEDNDKDKQIEKQLEKQIEEYTVAMTLAPTDASLYGKRADVYSAQANYKEVIKDLTKAISLEPGNGQYFYDRHWAYYFLNEYELAIKDISRAIALKDKTESLNMFTELYSHRGQLYLDLNQYDNALKDYAKAVKINPNVYLNYKPVGGISKNKLNDALHFHNKMVAIRPKNYGIYSSRADIYVALKQYDKAIKDLTKAIELDSGFNCFNYNERGLLYQDIHSREKAKSDFTSVCFMENNESAGIDKFKLCANTIKIACNRLAEMNKDEARGLKWVKYSEAGNDLFYYDKTNIKQQSNKHIRVWIREEIADATEIVKQRGHNGLSTVGFENYSYSLVLKEIDCGNKQSGTLSIADYDNKDNVLDSGDIEHVTMHHILPDSTGESLYDVVCKLKKK